MKPFVCGIILILLLGAWLISCDQAQNVGMLEDDQRERVIAFEQPLTTQELVALTQNYGVKVQDITFEVGDITVGYRLKGEDFQQEMQEALRLHQETLSQILETINSGSLRKELEESINLASNSPVSFIRANFIGNQDLLDKMIAHGVGQEFTIKEKQPVTSAAPILQSTSHESWAPYTGGITISGSYIYNTFTFNNVSDYGLMSAYEHETLVYNRAWADYKGYWSSNLPKAYLDTQAFDRGNIDVFAVGAALGENLRANKQYYTYIRLKQNQSANPNLIQVKGQLSYRIYPTCYSTWCIFGKAHTGAMTQFSYVPTCRGWRY